MALAYLRAKTSKNAYFSRINAADKAKFREHLALLDMGLEDRMKQPVGLLSGGQLPGTDASYGDDGHTKDPAVR